MFLSLLGLEADVFIVDNALAFHAPTATRMPWQMAKIHFSLQIEFTSNLE
jgi:hypothetical protein